MTHIRRRMMTPADEAAAKSALLARGKAPNRLRRPVTLTLSAEARAALERLAAGPPKQDMSRVVERLLLKEVEKL